MLDFTEPTAGQALRRVSISVFSTGYTGLVQDFSTRLSTVFPSLYSTCPPDMHASRTANSGFFHSLIHGDPAAMVGSLHVTPAQIIHGCRSRIQYQYSLAHRFAVLHKSARNQAVSAIGPTTSLLLRPLHFGYISMS
jgi:hypothetical protein